MMDKTNCPHETVTFASGDYYLFCEDCLKYWCCNPKGDGALEGQDWPSKACTGGERITRERV